MSTRKADIAQHPINNDWKNCTDASMRPPHPFNTLTADDSKIRHNMPHEWEEQWD